MVTSWMSLLHSRPRSIFIILLPTLLLLLFYYVGSQLAHRPSITTTNIGHSIRYIKEHQTDQILFFNRVPKTGSEMLVLLLTWLQQDNQFSLIRLKNTVRRHLTLEEQLELSGNIGSVAHNNLLSHIAFDRHVYFTNFTNLGLKMPIYVNLIRDPIDKLVSRFYYARVTPRPGAATPPIEYKHKKSQILSNSLEECVKSKDPECTFTSGALYDFTIPYFCGHHTFCRALNNYAALAVAKRHVMEWYSVVGILEDLNATLFALEKNIPHFFRGVTQLYHNDLLAPHFNKNWHRPRLLDPVIEATLRKNLHLEYEFYDFIKQHLYHQIESIINKH